MFPIARHRSQLRDPYKLGSELRTVEPPAKPDHPLHQLLGPVLKKPASAQGKQTEALFLKNTLLGNFDMTPEYRAAFTQTLRQLHRDDVTTAVVLMPVSATYLASHPGGAATYDRWKQEIVRLARAAGHEGHRLRPRDARVRVLRLRAPHARGRAHLVGDARA